ncbi:MAG: hypothetical protein NTY77_10615 [Elusimicrobia bacterium]|nr:hypothetical protein [Elusimicrobiota bacterium]
MRVPRPTRTAALALSLLGAASWALASTMTVRLKDGTSTSYDTARIESVTFSESSARRAAAGKTLFEESFRSGLGDAWEPVAVVGGDFDRFAKLIPGRLEVAVPEGNHWTKTGIMSKAPFFTVAPYMALSPLKIDLGFDPAKTTGYVIGISEVKDADMWRQQNAWFHFITVSPTETSAYLVNTQNGGENYGSVKGPAAAPVTVTLSVSPGMLRVETSAGMKLEGRFSWLKPGVPVYLYVFSHPKDDQGPAAFALESIRKYTNL